MNKEKLRLAGITALLLDGNGGARELDNDQFSSWTEADGIIWIDCDQTNKAARNWLENSSGTHKNVSDILLAGETRPRSIIDANGVIFIVRGINMNPGAVPDDMVAIRIWLEKKRIITSHRRKVLSISDLQDVLKEGKGPRSAGDFLIDLIAHLATRIGAAVENIEELIEDLDSQVASGSIATVRTELSVVRRQAAAIRRHLAPQRDALDRLARTQSGILSTEEIFQLREEGDRFTRQLEDLDLARENALVTQEELMNRVAQEQNARVYLLSVVAAIFLPLTFVTGLLGMNVAGLPGTEDPRGFMISAIVMIALGIVLLVYFKWRKWI